MVREVNKLFLLFLFFSLFNCNEKRVAGYYEPKKGIAIMDEEINKLNINLNRYDLKKVGLSKTEKSKLDSILNDKNLHMKSDLGTCYVSGVFVFDNKLIYITCGTAQVFICDKNSNYPILLTEKGNKMLNDLIKN